MAKRIITISREYGSGGRTVGRMLAEKLGIAFYDKELIALIAKESGFTLEFIEETGEYKSVSSMLLNRASLGSYPYNMYGEETMPISDRINIIQNRIITQIANKEPCVIVGRSADFILGDRPDCVNVFIHAKEDVKLKRAVEFYGFDPHNAEKALRKKDKARANHYRHYTGQVFGMASNYHISLDSGLLGLEQCVDIIADIYRKS